ncbi:sulfate permease, SulP family [Succinivibrio dextrinosolvens]|uniref:SulP family inorganic anion transporter n=1 Tax=Succinivibrio dextrinosolvens TaxID=83771 RepID=UPI0008E08CAD|nr:SulP family inorganic anion transporter [Succinivibrio dextrinosolvens]SFS78441.1 sulfate permease, SulP family [Succinivibrio dextrinosolvens]
MKTANPLVPAFITCMREGYNFKLFRSDVIAGLTVAIVALPLAMAMAVASGASPDKGLVTAVVAGFFISFLGGSRVQIGGPTGAFVVVIFDIIQRFGFNGLILASIMAGLILIIAGYARLGKLIKYIPYPVITGFTTGIAVIIASSQVKDFLGLQVDSVPADFINKWYVYLSNLDKVTYSALAMGALGLATIIICKKISPKIPSYLVSILLISALAYGFSMDIETIGTRFPSLPTGLPTPVWPEFSLEQIRALVPSAFTIAFLAGIEALLSAVVADGLIGHKHSLNQELVGQGVANIASGIFGGIPATGAIARTATNIKAGGRTPVAGIFHAIFLLVFLYTAMDILAFIPMAALAAVLFMVSWGMSDLKHFTQIAKISPSDRTILFLTFALTVMVDLTVAIGVGVTFASLLFMRHMSRSVEIRKQHCKSEYETHDGEDPSDDEIDIPDDVTVLQINGPLFYGFASEFCDRLKALEQLPRILILRMRFMPYLDASGENSIEEILNICRQHKTFVIFSAVRPQPRKILERAGLHKKLDGAIAADFDEALKMAKNLLKDEDFIMKHIDPTKA